MSWIVSKKRGSTMNIRHGLLKILKTLNLGGVDVLLFLGVENNLRSGVDESDRKDRSGV
jgi:hypothetical protein